MWRIVEEANVRRGIMKKRHEYSPRVEAKEVEAKVDEEGENSNKHEYNKTDRKWSWKSRKNNKPRKSN
jgi:hypothetical protein